MSASVDLLRGPPIANLTERQVHGVLLGFLGGLVMLSNASTVQRALYAALVDFAATGDRMDAAAQYVRDRIGDSTILPGSPGPPA